jgi:16S rRNA (guanine966-N2)-methyltransferase
MRVISGRFKGRRLSGFKGGHLRPTMDRVKETLFNILQNDIEDRNVLDLFAGTGSLGIEALSRGAKSVVMVESHPQSLKIIRENLSSLKIEDGITVIPKDVFRFIKSTQATSYEIVFIDPPFTEKLAHKVMTELGACTFIAPKAVVAIEAAKQERIDDDYPGFLLLDRRPFGDKSLSIFQKRG